MTESTPAPRSAQELAAGLRQVERELAATRRFGRRALKELHRTLIADLRVVEKRLAVAEARAQRAEAKAATLRRRARHAETELSAVRESTTWKTGRAVLAVPLRLRRRVRARR